MQQKVSLDSPNQYLDPIDHISMIINENTKAVTIFGRQKGQKAANDS